MPTRRDYKLVQKDVKHARIRVSEDGSIGVVLPVAYTTEDANLLIDRKAKWIEKGLKYFDKKSKIRLQRNELLLYGNRFRYFYEPAFSKKVIIDREHLTIRTERNLLDPEIQIQWYRGLAKKYLSDRASELAVKLKFSFDKIYIRNQKTKWGNCSADRNISLNWRLIKAPLFVIDYLILHELVHTEVMNHRRKFWMLLRSVCPDYRDAVDWLDKYGNHL